MSTEINDNKIENMEGSESRTEDEDKKIVKECNGDIVNIKDHNDNVISETSEIPEDKLDEQVKESEAKDEKFFCDKPLQDVDTASNDSETFIDILGNGFLTKKILSRGLGRETRPSHGDIVTISYSGFNSSDEKFVEDTTTFIVGDGDMLQAFDLGICLAEKHEEFELKSDARFAYGDSGLSDHVKPKENVTFHIKLLNVDDPPDYATYSYDNRLAAVDKKRERGNDYYRNENYSLAVNSYSKALKIINLDPDHKLLATDPGKSDLFDLFIKVTNNLAAAQLKLESYESVIETCNSILEYEPENVKALFRKGKSLVSRGVYNDALEVLRRAQELENSRLISAEIQRCLILKRQEDEQRARICRRMFGANGNFSSSRTGSMQGVGCSMSRFARIKAAAIKYSPYIGAVIVTGISVTLATLAITKSKAV